MRTLLLAFTALVVAACSDTPQSTAPHTGGSARDRQPSDQGIKIPDAKPADQVGFTKITRVVSSPKSFLPGWTGMIMATCPDGTTIVGGGYRIFGGGINHPLISFSDINEAYPNAWSIELDNPAAGASGTLYAVALCAS
jgi:hypothetical protein